MHTDRTPNLRVTLLGHLTVEGADGTARPISGTAANFFGALATAPGHFLSVAGLAQDVWPDRPPQHPKAALQTIVSRLRAHCWPGLIRSTPGGYGIDLDGGVIDLSLARSLLAEARAELRAGAARAANELCLRAEGLWYGEPGAGVANPALAAEINELAATCRTQLARLRAEAVLTAGGAEEAVVLLTALAREAPYDDQLVLLLLRALTAVGRTSQAIEAYGEFRTRLADELGVDPAPEVAAFYEALLRQDQPLARTGPRRVGLRAPIDTLFGRDQSIETVDALLRTARLVTITGAGGLGKTRLAHAVAWQVADRVPAAVVVDLVGARSGADVMHAILAALDLPAAGQGPAASGGLPPGASAVALEALAEHATLLVLDNCEQVAEPVAQWVAAILTGVATTRILATSRTPLRVRGEHVLELEPLAARAPSGTPGPAVAMFRARAAAVRPGVVLDEDLVARLCARLEGIPLGIELAAARVRSLTVTEIEAALDDRFAILRTTNPASDSRHRTLHDVIDWSWALLTDRQQLLCRRVAVFPDGFDARAAGYLTGASPIELLDDLDALVAHSLLRVEEDLTTGGMRYRMYETLREFAELQAVAADEAEVARLGAARWCQDFAATCLRESVGPSQAATFHRVALERENLRAVLRGAGAADDLDTLLAAGFVLTLNVLTRLDLGELGSVITVVAGPTRGHRAPTNLTAAQLWFWALAVGYQAIFGTPRDVAMTLTELRRIHRDEPSPGPVAEAFTRVMLAVGDPERFGAEIASCASSPDPGARRLGLLLGAYFAENSGDLVGAAAAGRAAHEIAVDQQDTWTAAYAAQLLAGIYAQGRRPAETITWATSAATGFALLGVDAPLRSLARHVACVNLLVGDLDSAQAAFAAFLAAEHPAGDGELFGRAGLAEVALARAAAASATAELPENASAAVDLALTDYRTALAAADWSRPETQMWLILLGSSCVAQHVLTGHSDDPHLAELVKRFCAHVVTVHRGRPENTDRPLLGAVAGAMALWAASQDAPDYCDLVPGLLVAMDTLHSRQDLPALDRDRIRGAAHDALGLASAGPVDPADPRDPDAVYPTGADATAGVLDLLEELVTRL